MRVFLAGATGAVGRPLLRALRAHGHDVIGLTTTETGAEEIVGAGGTPVIDDVTNKSAILDAVASSRAEAIINELTSLPKTWTAEDMRDSAERDRRVRLDGNANLLEAAEAAGIERFVVQSSAFWYAPGDGLADEETPFAFDGPGRIAEGTRTYEELERTTLSSTASKATILRYGFFYGSGTWYGREGSVAEQVRKGEVPIVGSGDGMWSWIHVEDAAEATVAALTGPPGIYNVVDDDPSPQRVWLPAYARWLGGPPPPHVSEQMAAAAVGEDVVYYAMRLRGSSNAKAKTTLGFRPRRLEWLSS